VALQEVVRAAAELAAARLPALILHLVVECAVSQHAHRLLTEDVKFPPHPEVG
jgi:hypothetical protein